VAALRPSHIFANRHVRCERCSNGYGKQVPITFHVSPDVCDAIITDEEWLWQMLLNLLTNACKYTDKGGIQVKIRVTTDVALPDSEKGLTMATSSGSRSVQNEALLFEVIDTGA
jgi:signal transduction histidine kinase